MDSRWDLVKDTLLAGKVVVAPTDTVYGLLGVVNNPQILKQYQKLKSDRGDKPYIILISQLSDLKLFGVELTEKLADILNQLWPGSTSVILPCRLPAHLSHIPTMPSGKQPTLAFRLPAFTPLLEVINATGPVFAPSCNPSGLPPSTTSAEVRQYFSPSADLVIPNFIDTLTESPSTIVDLSATPIKIIRPGANLSKVTKILNLD